MNICNGIWPAYKLGDPDVCILNPKKKECAEVCDETLVSFVPMAQVDDISGCMDASLSRKLGDVRKGYTYFAEGDVVFAKITPCMENGKAAIARNLINGIGFGTTEFHVLRSGSRVISEWLHLFVRSSDFRNTARKNMHGAAGQQRVPVEFLQESEIPVPPLNEQRRIVARIEELTRRAEEVRKLRQETAEKISTLMPAAIQSILEEGHDFVEASIGEICSMKTGKTPPTKQSEYFDGDILFVCPSDVGGSLKISKSERHLTVQAITDGKANLFKRGTVLLVGIGSTVGKVGIAECDLCTNQQITGLVFNNSVLPEYAAWYLSTQRNVIRNAAAGGGVPIINQKGISQLHICYPKSIDEQRTIVLRLDALQEKLVKLAAEQNSVDEDLESFQPALLAKAFRGEL